MDNLRELLKRELASEAEDLSSLLSQEFQVLPEGGRPADAYVFEIEKALPGVSKAGE
jgi:hypothetical protein